jgi:hypothetical protein
MGINEIATKQDIEDLKQLLRNIPSGKPTPPLDPEKTGMTSTEVRKALGGVSHTYLENLRKDGVLLAKKVGSIWIYNYRQVMDLIPDYKK